MSDAARKAAAERVLRRGREEQLTFSEKISLRAVVSHVDPRLIPEDFWPFTLTRAYRLLHQTGRPFGFPLDAAQAAEVAVTFICVRPRSATVENLRPVVEFFRAGIPAELTVEVLREGGTLQQAEAIRDGSAPPGLSSGAL